MQKKVSLYIVVFVLPVIQDCVSGPYSLIHAEFLGAFAEFLKATLLPHVSLSVGPRGTPRVPLVRFSLKFSFEDFFKICRQN